MTATRPVRGAPWWAYASLAASMALVGSYVGLSKWLVAAFPVFLLAWLRFGIGAVAMAGWVRRAPSDAPLSAPLDAQDRRLLFWESFFGNFLFSVCMLYGVKLSTALAAGVILAALPGAVALLSWACLAERPHARTLAGVGCAVAGIALVTLSRHGVGDTVGATAGGGAGGSALNPLFGDALLGHALLIGAVLCEASYVVIGKLLAARVSPKRISALINLWGLALVTPLGVWQALRFDFGAVTPGVWTLLVFYSLAASVFTVWLWMTGLRHVPASQAGVFTVLMPVAAAAVGVVLLGENLSAAQAGAFGLALLGIVLATWPGRAATS